MKTGHLAHPIIERLVARRQCLQCERLAALLRTDGNPIGEGVDEHREQLVEPARLPYVQYVPGTDRFSFTLQAFVLTLLAAAGLPLVV